MMQFYEIAGFLALVTLSLIGVTRRRVHRRNHDLEASQLEMARITDLEIKLLEDKILFLQAMADSRDREIESLRRKITEQESFSAKEDPWSDEKYWNSKMILGIDADMQITQKDLKSAYIKAMKKYHPDNGGSALSFRMTKDAFDYLSSKVN